ncbi:glucose-1-phosphate cytidylyltransferase [Humitalea rosea]|uniref:Glucose-1-phosphate cytidylyltransferase n=1 Tax=Humitalea rosea TaxID=990373 RepID=A0A2W7I5P8_9PROT|nr:glucose-1-phosphate cytidylyltransferase [Humitalea rosea]PZW40802.1 glucose-1-phosphate cytidylyltransferase [Humitalea rosea]
MKVVLFCGGQGLRMRSDSNGNDLPKPMVPLGPRPILWHLMKYYAHFGHKDFILCLGYKGATIKEFFANYQEWISNDFVLEGGGRRLDLLKSDIDDWRITLVDTGIESNIGERLMAVRRFLQDEEMFLANYSDGLSDCPVQPVIDRLIQTDAVAACMVARPNISVHLVEHASDGLVHAVLDAEEANMWINAGFFAFRREIFDYIRPGEELVLEPFRRLIATGKLAAYPYSGFWRCCDTFKDLQNLAALAACGPAPWEVWRHPVLRPPPMEVFTFDHAAAK